MPIASGEPSRMRDGREVGRVVGSRPRAYVAGVLDRVIHGDVAVSAP